jgi:hypothetical protein
VASGPGFHPDVSSVALDNLFTDGEPDAGAGICAGGMQPLEEDEHALPILLLDTHPVVPNGKLPHLTGAQSRNADVGRIRAVEFEGIGDQIILVKDI